MYKNKVHPNLLIALGLSGAISVLFSMPALIPNQGSASYLIIIFTFLSAILAAPGWLELTLMYPEKVGGVVPCCDDAFKKYAPILMAVIGVSYASNWCAAVGISVLTFGDTIKTAWFPCADPIYISFIVLIPTFLISLLPLRYCLSILTAICLGVFGIFFLTLASPFVENSFSFLKLADLKLVAPFEGAFGTITSILAGSFLVLWFAPGFESFFAFIGDMKDPEKTVYPALKKLLILVLLFGVGGPLVWYASMDSSALASTPVPNFSNVLTPLLGKFATAFSTLISLFGFVLVAIASYIVTGKVLYQLSKDGYLPRSLSLTINNTNIPWFAHVVTLILNIAVVLLKDLTWLVVATSFPYILCLSIASLAVWILRRDSPQKHRPYRAPDFFIYAGIACGGLWILSAFFGFQQYGLNAVLFGIFLSYSGLFFYAWRKYSDRLKMGVKSIPNTLQLKLTGMLIFILMINSIGYVMAIQDYISSEKQNQIYAVLLQDIFIIVAFFTITIGITIPGIVAETANEVSKAAHSLTTTTIREFINALKSLAKGDLEGSEFKGEISPINVRSKDELGEMAQSFNTLQEEIMGSVSALNGARSGLKEARENYDSLYKSLEDKVNERTQELLNANSVLEVTLKKLKDAQAQVIHTEKMAGLGNLISGISHEINTPAGAIANSVLEIKSDYKGLLEDLIGLVPILEKDLQDKFIKGCYLVLNNKKELSTSDARQLSKELSPLLEERHIEDARTISKELVMAGINCENIADFIDLFTLPEGRKISESFFKLGMSQIHVHDIEIAISRITHLVKALKL
jgi:amino acid transporter